jgi:ribonucleoside-diphosphate reductase alpha chain
MYTYLGIQVHEEDPHFINEFNKTLLEEYYSSEDETIPQMFARAATAYCWGDLEFAQKIYDYAYKGWFQFASPVLSNAPKVEKWVQSYICDWMKYPEFNAKGRGLPISCFLQYVGDSIKAQVEAAEELAYLSVSGGGVGSYLNIRGVTEKSPGPIPYIKTIDSNIQYYHQGGTRRGSAAVYLDVNHPDIEEFINIRVPTGGDPNRKAFNIHNAVNITDEFLNAIRDDKEIDLVQPHNKQKVKSLSARDLWERILESRYRTGEPYIHYVDEANRRLSQVLKDKGLEIKQSNLCIEIELPTNEDRTAVCCLSSVNLEYYDEWKDTDLVGDLVQFLDNVLEFFIQYAPEELRKAVLSASSSRDIGLGAMGFHSYLQSKMIPFESGGFNSAAQLTHIIHKDIYTKALDKTIELGKIRGEPADIEGTSRRNAHLISIAPNANSSIIANCSASIEPIKSNAYTHRTRIGAYLVKNKHLERLLNERITDPDYLKELWKSIITNDGSVQHIDVLTDEEKKVFKTAMEIDQHWVIELARIRSEWIDQGQSINTFFPKGADKAYVNSVHLRAFSNEGLSRPLKGLYYLRTEAKRKAEAVSMKVTRRELADYATQDAEENKYATCLSCEG